MITLMSASVARKESELNMEYTVRDQWEEIKDLINKAVRAGKFKIQLEEDLFNDNIIQLEKLGYIVEYVYSSVTKSDWVWQISW